MRGFVPILGKPVQHESLLERDFLIHLTMDPTLKEVVSQPVKIRFKDNEGLRRQYTPDFFVRNDGPHGEAYLIEIKFRAELFEQWRNLKPKLMAGRRVARENGWRFMILTEVEIRGTAFENAAFLHPYADLPRNERHEEHLAHRLAIIGPATPDKLLAAAYAASANREAAINYLWKLIATGRIRADLTAPLSMSETPIWIDYDRSWAPYDPYSWSRVRRKADAKHFT